MGDKGERRLFSRYLIDAQTAIRANLWHNLAKSAACKQAFKDIIDISGGGFSFKSDPSDDLLLPGTFLEKIEILSPEGRLLETSGEIKYISFNSANTFTYCSNRQPAINSLHPFYRIGVEFEAMSAGPGGRDLQKQADKISDPVELMHNLRQAAENATPVSLENLDNPLYHAIPGHITQMKESAGFQALIFEPVNKLDLQLFESLDRVQVVYQSRADGYRFASVVIAHLPGRLALKLPKSINHLWRRGTLRHVPAEDDSLRLQIEHPLLKEEILERQVVDLTPGGVGIAIRYPQDLFIQGMLIPRVTLVIPGEENLIAQAQVKYICISRDIQARDCFKCGLSFINLPPAKADYLVSYLMRKCHPHLQDGRGERVETIWELFSESGFLYEEKRKFLAPAAQEINFTFQKLLEPDTRFYKKIILKDDHKCYGAVSGIWAYEHTWIIQHLAAIKHPHYVASRDVVLAIADFCSKHPEVGYQMIYWRPDNSWSDKVFGKYARRMADRPDLSHLICYDYLLRASMGGLPEKPLPEGVIIKPLDEAGRPLIESYFINRGEFVILKAHSLVREEIDLPDLSQIYRQKGLHRERQIYIAVSEQHFLGFVLIEDSSLGTNLSGLINHFKVYITPECRGLEQEVRYALIRQAIEYYRSRGRHFSLCLSPAGEDTCLYEAMGFKKKKAYMCWTFSRKLAQPYFNFVDDFFSRVEERIHRNDHTASPLPAGVCK